MDQVLLTIWMGVFGISVVLVTTVGFVAGMKVTRYIVKKLPKKTNKECQDV